MSGPDFVFVGPSKSGSTWIFELLRSHPQVFVPVAKDIYFFDRHYSKGREWYESFFAPAKRGQVRGEISHDYLANREALQRLAAMYPSVKVMCCLRNPYDRAISSYRYFVRNGLVSASLADAIKDHPEIVNEGLYATHMASVLELFPRDRILTLHFDELVAAPERTARRLFEFLGVDPSFRSPVMTERINAAAAPRSRLVAKAAKLAALSLRRWGFASLVGAVKRNRAVKWILYRKWSASNQTLSEAFPSDVVELYEQDIRRTSEILGRNYKSWCRFPAGNGTN